MSDMPPVPTITWTNVCTNTSTCQQAYIERLNYLATSQRHIAAGIEVMVILMGAVAFGVLAHLSLEFFKK